MAYGWQKFYHYFWVSAKETELIQQSELDCFVNKTFFVFLRQFQFENRRQFQFFKIVKKMQEELEPLEDQVFPIHNRSICFMYIYIYLYL